MKHYQGEPEKDADEKPEGFYELIIESGFMIYYLLLMYKNINNLDQETESLLAELEKAALVK